MISYDDWKLATPPNWDKEEEIRTDKYTTEEAISLGLLHEDFREEAEYYIQEFEDGVMREYVINKEGKQIKL